MDTRHAGEWRAAPRSDGDGVWTLAPGTRELRVQLRLLAFDAPAGNRYETRLDGYDTHWLAHGQGADRVLAGLAPGEYTLHARGIDAHGNRSATRHVRFRIQPPWWRTSAARTVAVLLVGALAWMAWTGYRQRQRRRLAWQRAEHERQVAQRASEAKSRFLATLGHEVRTPMTGVLGMSELLLDTPLDARQQAQVRSIRQAGEHLLRLVNDALDLARIEAGRMELDPRPFRLHDLVREAEALMAPLARQRGLALRIDVDADVPLVVAGDAKRVCQILLNLLGNAIKFTERGHVALRVQAAGDGVRFTVTDTGPGLDPAQQARLFQRFSQADGEATQRRYGGSGLGLAISQELAAATGGRSGERQRHPAGRGRPDGGRGAGGPAAGAGPPRAPCTAWPCSTRGGDAHATATGAAGPRPAGHGRAGAGTAVAAAGLRGAAACDHRACRPGGRAACAGGRIRRLRAQAGDRRHAGASHQGRGRRWAILRAGSFA